MFFFRSRGDYPILYDTINIFIYSHFIIACQLVQRLYYNLSMIDAIIDVE